MSSLSLSGLTGSLAAGATTPVPAAVRSGGAKAQQAYQTGLAFEQMLVSQLTQELQSTTSSDGSDGSDGSGGSSGLLGGSGSSDMLGQLLPQTLSQSLSSAGGLGIASQIATSIDPALRGKLS